MSDAYADLGITRTASEDDIKKAFRSLAQKHHPDKGGNIEVFKKVSAAYALISTPEKRRSYDLRFGPVRTAPQYAAPKTGKPTAEFWRDAWKSDPAMQKATEDLFNMFKDASEDLKRQAAKTARDLADQQEKIQRQQEWFNKHRSNHYGA